MKTTKRRSVSKSYRTGAGAPTTRGGAAVQGEVQGWKPFYSVREASVMINKSDNAVRKIIKKGDIRVVKARDGSIRIRGEELCAYVTGVPLETAERVSA